MDKIAEANSEIAANVFSDEFVHVWNCARVKSHTVINILFHRIQKQNLFYLLFLSPRQRKPSVSNIATMYCNGREIIPMIKISESLTTFSRLYVYIMQLKI